MLFQFLGKASGATRSLTMTKRVFAFGCSLTDYRWPTWADIIGRSYHNKGYEYYNFGNSGSGNQYIANSLHLANIKYKFTPDDIIIVMWSSWTREDRYILDYSWDLGVRGQWTKEGNILNAVFDSPRYEPSFLKYWSLENDIVKNIVAVNSARKMYNITFEEWIPIHEPTEHEKKHLNEEPDIGTEIYNKYIEHVGPKGSKWNDILKSVGTPEDPIGVQLAYQVDGHPLPLEALKYVQLHTNFDIDDDTINYATQFHQLIVDWASNYNEGTITHDVAFDKQIARKHHIEKKEYRSGDYFDLWTDDCFIDLLDDFF